MQTTNSANDASVDSRSPKPLLNLSRRGPITEHWRCALTRSNRYVLSINSFMYCAGASACNRAIAMHRGFERHDLIGIRHALALPIDSLPCVSAATGGSTYIYESTRSKPKSLVLVTPYWP